MYKPTPNAITLSFICGFDAIALAVTVNAGLAEKKGIHFNLGPVHASLGIHADNEQLMRVITNLLSNAVKFSPDGETVTLTAQARGAVARVSVIDRGSGIPEAFMPRMFERFAQADGSNTRVQGGTGLGLAVCKVLIEGMGGQIGFVSEAGKGGTFYFDLPIVSDLPHIAPGDATDGLSASA